MSTDREREALAPCPFCGSEHPTTVYVRDGRRAYCPDCRASGPAEYNGPAGIPDAEDRAIVAWNRRAAGWMPRPEPGSTDSVIAAFRIAAEVIAADEDRLRKLRVFADYWPTIDAYDPPPEVAEDVSEIVRAMVVLADAHRAALGTGDPDAE